MAALKPGSLVECRTSESRDIPYPGITMTVHNTTHGLETTIKGLLGNYCVK